jgi:NitT/TauT family transport system substrate-binding protein
MTKLRIFLMAVVFFLCIACHAWTAEKSLQKVSFIPQWVPQAQFAGYYMAYEKGIYKRYGMDLTIIPGGPERSPSDLLKKGDADFATLWLTTGIQLRAQGIGVVNIAQMLRRSALMLIAKKSSGIERPEDMNGRKVGLWSPVFQIQPRAFFKKYDLVVRTIPQSYSVNLFLRDGVHVASAMWYNEYHAILNSGLNPDELTTFFFHEHGLNFPEDGIYVLEETYRKNPELCRSFVKASMEGWQYAFEHPDETIAVIMRNLEKEHIPATAVHQKWMLNRMKDLMLPDGNGDESPGSLRPEDYHRVAMGLKSNGLIDEMPGFTSFYRGKAE